MKSRRWRPRAGRGRGSPRRSGRELHRGGDHQLHDPHLESARSPKSLQERVRRVLQDRLPRLRKPGPHYLRARGRVAQLRRPHVRAEPRAVGHVLEDYKRGLALCSSTCSSWTVRGASADYFGFVRGVVDSSDLTLNISPRDAAAQRPTARHRPASRRRRSRPIWRTCATMTVRPTEVLQAVRPYL